MITPRRTRLVRVPGLAGLRDVLTSVVGALSPSAAADTFVLVPTRAAGEVLRRSLEHRLLNGATSAMAWPRVGTRGDFYRELGARLDRSLDVLAAVDREVVLFRMAREVQDSGLAPPFHLRPALVAEMLALYDHIRRQARTLADFDRNIRAELEPAVDTDRGAAALLQQTEFLSAVFQRYETDLAARGLADEHSLREALLESPARAPLRRAVVTVADRVAETEGLWPVDFTVLAQVPGLEEVEVVATEAILAAGFLERIHAALPGIEEVAHRSSDANGARASLPSLVVRDDSTQAFSSRDREEELSQAARRIKADRLGVHSTPLHRTAIVVRRPLPYLYLARSVFGSAGLPFETLDTLPLAAEPYAAAVDLVLDFVATSFARESTIALLRSPHFLFPHDEVRLPADAIAALDRALAGSRYLGGIDRLAGLADEWARIDVPASRDERQRKMAAGAAHVASRLARELIGLTEARPVMAQVATLRAFLDRYRREPEPPADLHRQRRVRQAVLRTLDALARVAARHDPEAVHTIDELSRTFRRWLGAQTLGLLAGSRGIQLLDAQAARYADVDDVQLAGLVEGEWPEGTRRNIFYPPFLLRLLEPLPAADDPNRREGDARRAARAQFADLLGLARHRVRASTFALESDAVVEPSTFLDDLATCGLDRHIASPPQPLRVFDADALWFAPMAAHALAPNAADWARARARRGSETGLPEARFRGEAGPWILPRVSASRIDRYLKCPFQFFASEVLRLEEEPEDEDAPPPWERGRFLHALFERFFTEWQQRGYGRITADRMPEARALLVAMSEEALAGLTAAEAALERPRLFGSAVGAGIIDRVLSMEAEREDDLERRLIEYEIDDAFPFRRADGGTRTVHIRAKVDRVDLLRNGFFRVIDYKSRFVPDLKRSVQLQVYTSAVAHQLRRAAGGAGERAPAEAFYLSMEGDSPIKALKPGRDQSIDDLLAAAEDRLLSALDAIGAGHFPPRPVPRSLCVLCPFDAVCRKAFVDADDE